jgi:hypothetical protein
MSDGTVTALEPMAISPCDIAKHKTWWDPEGQ